MEFNTNHIYIYIYVLPTTTYSLGSLGWSDWQAAGKNFPSKAVSTA